MKTILNPIQAHSYGRALTVVKTCVYAGVLYFTKPDQQFPSYWDEFAREYRVVAHYEVIAEIDKPYLVGVNGERVFWDQARILSYLADGQKHDFHVSFVAEEIKGYLQPMRPSHNNQPHMLQRFHNDQIEAGIPRQSPLYIHPLDRMSKDAYVADLLQGIAYDVSAVQSIVEQFERAEQMDRDLLTLEDQRIS